MKRIKDLFRNLVPFGLIDLHRRDFQLSRLGLPPREDVARAVMKCRFELWPVQLRRAPKPWTLVDVGANCGEFTAAAAQLATLAEVHAFEPQPQCHDQLQRVLTSIPRGHLHQVAVGAHTGEIELLCTAESSMSSVLAPDAIVSAGYTEGDFVVEQRIKVPLVRLDDVIREGTEVGLLKIDVQGYELQALEGAKITLRSTFALLMEVNYVAHYEGGATYDEVHEVVRSFGFRTFGISAPYSGPNGPLWADALFVRDV